MAKRFLRAPLGTKLTDSSGYVRIRTSDGWDYEHRVVWRERHGAIPPGASIHHRNGDRADNRIENLSFMRSHTEHMQEHPDLGNRYRGKSLSPEHRAKLSAAAKRRNASPERRAELSALGTRGAMKRWHQA